MYKNTVFVLCISERKGTGNSRQACRCQPDERSEYFNRMPSALGFEYHVRAEGIQKGLTHPAEADADLDKQLPETSYECLPTHHSVPIARRVIQLKHFVRAERASETARGARGDL